MDDVDEWVEKCINCSHSYKRKNDDDLMYCRLRGVCRFESFKDKKSQGAQLKEEVNEN